MAAHLHFDVQDRLRIAQAEGSTAAAGSTSRQGAVSCATSAMAQGPSESSPAVERPRGGKGSRGPRPRLFKKGECQADGCTADLTALPRYNMRNHICLAHKAADSFFKQGVEVRFCQRCGVSHPLAEYDGLKKSCRRMLALHNNRRRKSPSSASPSASAAAPGSGSPLRQQQPQEQQEQVQVQVAEQQPKQPLVASPAAAPLPTLREMALWAAEAGVSPTASIGSAAAGGNADSWLLADSSKEGSPAELLPPPDPPAPLWAQPQQAAAAAGGEVMQPAGALAGAAPRHERVCCAGNERVCCCSPCHASAAAAAAAGGEPSRRGGALVGCAAAGGRAAGGPMGAAAVGQPGRGAAAAAAAAGAGRGAGGCGALDAAPGPAADATRAPSCSDSAAAGGAADAVDSVSQPAAAPVSSGGGMDPAAEASAVGQRSAGALAALSHLQQRNAALYQLFVQQQLLAAQTLLTTAGFVLSQRLPLTQPPASPSVSAC